MDTLLLSAAWEPVQQITWRRAMTLWVAGRVEVIEAYAQRRVRTVSTSYELPAVIRFLRGKRRRRMLVRFSRGNLYLRDRGRCQYCGVALSRAAATYDHVLPRSRGGPTSWENLVVACRPCNQVKAARTPQEAGLQLRSKPHKPKSLPALWCAGLRYQQDMPEQWRPYLAAAPTRAPEPIPAARR